MNLRNNTILLFAFVLLFSLSCSNEDADANVGNLNISAKASFTNLASKGISAKGNAGDIVIDDFLLNISEFELEIDYEDNDHQGDQDDLWDDDGYYDYEDEIELMGPFELDLMSGQITFLNVDVPLGTYEELEFEFDVSTDSSSDLFGKSVLIRGTIDDTPFVFWHDFEDEVEVDFEDQQFDITISQIAGGIVIEFDIGLILSSTYGVDLSLAKDGNMDGTIEISPEDNDGNNQLAEAIRHKIKEYINLLDD